MATELTTAELAEALGVGTRRVLQIADARGLTDELSRKVGQARLWRRSAIDKLRPRPTGGAGHLTRAASPLRSAGGPRR